MKKIVFVLTMVLCSLFANAQQLEPNYRYSFWSNWNLGVGAVYSKPFDLNTWAINDGANIGADLRFEKPLSNTWAVRLDACVPGFIKSQSYDRYGTAMLGFRLNMMPWVYLFTDGGLSYKLFDGVDDNKFMLACDYGLGFNFRLTSNAKLYLEAGSDCSSYISTDNSHLFGKLGLLCNLGVVESDRQNIALLHETQNGVSRSEYDRLVEQKKECADMLNNTIDELNKMRNCCQANNEKYAKEIAELKEALAAQSKTETLPFSILFAKNSVDLTKEAKEVIAQIAIEMNDTGCDYTLYGFGDYTGTEEYNEVLSASRCESVLRELVKHGVEEEKIHVVGLGKSQYFGTPESYVNRRVMFVKNN